MSPAPRLVKPAEIALIIVAVGLPLIAAGLQLWN